MQSESSVPEAFDVYSVVAVMVDQMAALAWQKMGLQADPLTGKIEKDIEQARTAIDIVGELCKHIEGRLDGEDLRQIQNLQRDLKINFVQQAAREGV